jgi:hypothetical protein
MGVPRTFQNLKKMIKKRMSFLDYRKANPDLEIAVDMNATFFAQFMRWVIKTNIRLEDDSPEEVAGTIQKLLRRCKSVRYMIH